MTLPQCFMCDDTGFKDHASFRMEPCDHLQLPPLPDLLPCPNPNCEGSDPRYRAGAKIGQYISCGGCGLMVTDGGQDRLYATWNGLLRALTAPPIWETIATAPMDRTSLVVLVPLKEGGFIQGRAYFDVDAYGGSWWWIDSPAWEYTADSIDQCNHGEPVYWLTGSESVEPMATIDFMDRSMVPLRSKGEGCHGS